MKRLDAFLMQRVFQPAVDTMEGRATPADAARFFLTGAMVLLLARMLASAAVALPTWPVLFDFAALWGSMALMRAVGMHAAAAAGRGNPLRDQLGLARPTVAFMTVLIWAHGLHLAGGEPRRHATHPVERGALFRLLQPARPPSGRGSGAAGAWRRRGRCRWAERAGGAGRGRAAARRRLTPPARAGPAAGRRPPRSPRSSASSIVSTMNPTATRNTRARLAVVHEPAIEHRPERAADVEAGGDDAEDAAGGAGRRRRRAPACRARA